MANGMSDYLEVAILNHVCKNTAYTQPSILKAALHFADPGDTGASEVTTASYARQTVTFGGAAAGSITNGGTLTWTTMPACTVSHVSIWDSTSGGNCLFSGALTAAKTVQTNDTFTINAANLTITLD